MRIRPRAVEDLCVTWAFPKVSYYCGPEAFLIRVDGHTFARVFTVHRALTTEWAGEKVLGGHEAKTPAALTLVARTVRGVRCEATL